MLFLSLLSNSGINTFDLNNGSEQLDHADQLLQNIPLNHEK